MEVTLLKGRHMAVMIRLMRVGKKHEPKYRIIVTDKRVKRDGAYLEELGFYDPISNPHLVKIDKKKYEEWIKLGAKPTKTVKLLAEA